jgi:hypothetical protein
MYQGMDGRGRRTVVRRAWATLAAVAGLSFAAAALPDSGPADADIRLQISPRICTLTGNEKQCATPVRAQWHSNHDESLCLVILARQEVHHCWEHYKAGTYSIDLVFSDDVVFQLRDVSFNRVLASEVLRVIREAIQYRHRRRQPWNIFN